MEKPNHVEEALDSEPFASAPNGFSDTTRSTPDVAETITVLEDEESPSKRRKTPPTRRSPRTQEVDDASPFKAVVHPAEIIEPTDNTHINGKSVSLPTTLSPPTVTKSVFGGLKTSAPKEPSKLRYSFHADKVEVKNADAIPVPPLSSLFAPLLVPPLAIPTTTTAPAEAKLSPKEEALAMSVDELPKYTFSVTAASSFPVGPSLSAARNSVLSLAITSLPVYEFTSTIAPARAMNGFNWTAAGMNAPTAAQTWTCSLCCLQNPADAKEKCTICDAPRQASTPSSLSSTPTPASTSSAPVVAAPPIAPSKSFDWSAAGMKALTTTQTWTCSVCCLQNPADAKEKCTICDAPRQAPTSSSLPPTPPLAPASFTPFATAPPTSPLKSFDWSAAGLTPPLKLESGAWSCSVCSLSNPASAADKCSICDAPR